MPSLKLLSKWRLIITVRISIADDSKHVKSPQPTHDLTGFDLEAMQPQHGEQEIPPDWAIHPTGAQNRGTALLLATKDLLNRLLTCSFGGSIDPQGVPDLIRRFGRAMDSNPDPVM